MPKLIETIDAIARKKGRDVLYVAFYEKEDFFDLDTLADFDYKKLTIRNEIIDWLDKNSIGWSECGEFFKGVSLGYMGSLYLDVPFDKIDENYRKVEAFLENPDGCSKNNRVSFYFLPLESAMLNSHQDDPEF